MGSKRTNFRTAFLQKLGIEPQELSLLGWAGAALALVGWADVSVQNASETFFLKRVGVEYLPLAFLASSFLLACSTYAVGRAIADRDRPRLLPWVFGLLALALLPMWLLVRLGFEFSFSLLVVFSKQIDSIALLVFWIVMGDLLHGRQAKRLYAPLMGGLTLGSMVGSFVSGPFGATFGIDALLFFAAAILAVGALLTVPLRGWTPARLDRGLHEVAKPRHLVPLGPVDRQRSLRELWQESPLLRLLIITTLCGGLLGPMLYFQFSYVADIATAGEGGEQRLLALYAQFRGWIHFAVLVSQLTLTSRLYRYIGVPFAAGLSPVIYFVGFFGLTINLSLTAGVVAVAGAKLADDAIGDPASRVLFNLFPETIRARATSLLDPVKRVGGALGNVIVLGALAVGTAIWVGYAALPIAALWLLAAAILWRAYPGLLVQADRSSLTDADAVAQMLDPSTLRGLVADLASPDLERCRLAIGLVSEARPDLAVNALANAARVAPEKTRPLLVKALNRVLDKTVAENLDGAACGEALGALLADASLLGEQERAYLVRAFGRLSRRGDGSVGWVALHRALGDSSQAVRLAAIAAFRRLPAPPAETPDLDEALAAALETDDAAARTTAREELRLLLLHSPRDSTWEKRLKLLTRFDHEADRVEVAEALAEIARAHGTTAALAGETMLALRHHPDVQVRCAVLRFVGYAGLADQAPWLVENLTSRQEGVAAAAREGLLALGPKAANALMVKHCFGKRSTRDAILSIVSELNVDKETLRSLYEQELEWLRQTLVSLCALSGGTASPIVLQRLRERLDEGVHTVLLYLAAIHNEDRIAALDGLLRRTRGERQHAIVLEALEALLSPRENVQLLPFLEDRSLETHGPVVAAELGVSIPSFEQAARMLLTDTDELTRTLAVATLPEGLDQSAWIVDHEAVMTPVEIALEIRNIPIFERLTTRQLFDLAGVVREEEHPADTEIIRDGDDGSCMYFIVSGSIRVMKDDRTIAELGTREFFGEMALFEGEKRSATCVTTTPTKLLRIERADLMSLMEELPSIAIGICQSLSARIRSANTRV
jgi:hypothetical protein